MNEGFQKLDNTNNVVGKALHRLGLALRYELTANQYEAISSDSTMNPVSLFIFNKCNLCLEYIYIYIDL